MSKENSIGEVGQTKQVKKELLELHLLYLEENKFKVAVKKSPVGKGEIESSLPFIDADDEDWLDTIIKTLEHFSFDPNYFMLEGEQEWMVKEGILEKNPCRFHHNYLANIGKALYKALFPKNSSVEKLLQDSIRSAESKSATLVVQLQFEEDFQKRWRLADYPWELLHDDRGFLCHHQVEFSRYIIFDSCPPNLPPPQKLNVLLVSSAAFDPEQKLKQLPRNEGDAVRGALEQARDRGDIFLDELEKPTFDKLETYLTQTPEKKAPHVLHFDGHGLYAKRCSHCKTINHRTKAKCKKCGASLPPPQGYLLFEHEDGNPDYISAKQLGALLQKSGLRDGSRRGVVLVVLSACESARATGIGVKSMFNGAAQKLIEHRVPAVVAMQYSVTVGSAAKFAKQFYGSLGQKDSLTVAVSLGRAAMDVEGNQWYRPVLYLRWQDNEGGQLFQTRVDELVQQVRSRFHDNIQSLHGMMPLWGVDRCVPLGELFVDVNILEELSSSRRSEIEDLFQDFSHNPGHRSLDRIGLGTKQQRVSGLEVVAKDTNLMVVGKPGSGKTTYLQRVVTECNRGNLEGNRIPLLIKLREFVEDGREVGYCLKRCLERCWQLSDTETQLVLNQGRALVLLDGLDEVTGEDGKSIAKEIKRFARAYPQVRAIVTCRTQSFTGESDWKSSGFSFVEVADFNEAQGRSFAEHWFKSVMGDESAGLTKAHEFLEQLFLESNKPIRELAITPILLSLTCAVFHQMGKFYSKRSKLYEEGLELLLEQWDLSRAIERDEIYRDLSLERKLELLSYLAVKKFEQEQYVLFEQVEIEEYIGEFLEIGRRDSRAVLRAIEAQHGLLIERSQKVWSFSHLTFQEYLVAKWFCTTKDFENMSIQCIHKHWREVFFLTVELLPDTSNLLVAMKTYINQLVSNELEINSFLSWISKKVNAIKNNYKLAALRAIFLAFIQNLEDDPVNHLFTKIDRNFKNEYNSLYDLLYGFFSRPNNSTYDFAVLLIINKFEGEKLNVHFKNMKLPNRYWQPDDKLGFEMYGYSCLSSKYFLVIDANQYINRIILSILPPFEYYLAKDSSGWEQNYRWQYLDDWWAANNDDWSKQIQLILNNYRKQGNSWQLKQKQKDILQSYYYGNKILMDCLNSSASSHEKIRREIEETLLLPIAEIENPKGKKETQ